MHKIGILTYVNVPNFGANLQALSTAWYLKNKGFEPIIIKWIPEDFESLFLKNRDLGQPAEHFRFVEQCLTQTSLCRSDEDICNVIDKEGIDAIIIGSDAVLQHMSFLSRIQFPTKSIVRINRTTSDRIFPNSFWGTFYPKLKKKIPMAIMSASSQNSRYKIISNKTRSAMSNCLKNFAYISVRDKWTKDMLSYISNGFIVSDITPDPVFAFNENCATLIPAKEDVLKVFGLKDNYVLVSMKTCLLDNLEWMNGLRDSFKKIGLDCVALPMPTGVRFRHNFDYEIKTPLSPLYWYALIKYAKGYVGENMHPIVVSLHNSTPCFCFDTYGVLRFARIYCDEKSSKIYDIMNRFDVLGNRVNAYSRFWKCPTPDYVVGKILSFDKEKCSAYADEWLREYRMMMNTILQFFDN